MSHNLEQISSVALSALTVANHRPANSRATKFDDAARVEARITKLGHEGFSGTKGIRIKARRPAVDALPAQQIAVDFMGEDLYALREFLAELPEEAFVRPADPIEKPARWTDGDIIEEARPGTDLFWIWVRRYGRWSHGSGYATPSDRAMEEYLGGDYKDTFAILRQASGQDL